LRVRSTVPPASARPACEALVDEFKGVSGQPLRAALEESGRSASEYVAWIFFYDAPPSLCRSSELAVTKPGSRAILVCGSRFVRQMATDSRHAEATLIHEAFHSLVGETPPRRTTSRSGSRHAVGDGEPPRPAPYSSFRSTKHFR
jgi:hypothetical protein